MFRWQMITFESSIYHTVVTNGALYNYFMDMGVYIITIKHKDLIHFPIKFARKGKGRGIVCGVGASPS
jgi:hypothetical protein